MRAMSVPWMGIEAIRVRAGVLNDDFKYFANFRWEGTCNWIETIVLQRSLHVWEFNAIILL